MGTCRARRARPGPRVRETDSPTELRSPLLSARVCYAHTALRRAQLCTFGAPHACPPDGGHSCVRLTHTHVVVLRTTAVRPTKWTGPHRCRVRKAYAHVGRLRLSLTSAEAEGPPPTPEGCRRERRPFRPQLSPCRGSHVVRLRRTAHARVHAHTRMRARPAQPSRAARALCAPCRHTACTSLLYQPTDPFAAGHSAAMGYAQP